VPPGCIRPADSPTRQPGQADLIGSAGTLTDWTPTVFATTTLTAIPVAAAHLWAGPGLGIAFVLIPLFWLGVLALIVGLAGRRFRRAAWSHGGPGHFGPWASASRSAESTLAERFAQGDIDEGEYRARLEVLRANNAQQYPGKP
jgi:putative membrane protein